MYFDPILLLLAAVVLSLSDFSCGVSGPVSYVNYLSNSGWLSNSVWVSILWPRQVINLYKGLVVSTLLTCGLMNVCNIIMLYMPAASPSQYFHCEITFSDTPPPKSTFPL